jgi:hypothetical protein
MPVVGKYFPTQKPEEKIFLLLRRHWFGYVAFIIIGLVMSIPLIILFIYWVSFQQDFSPILLNISILAASIYLLFIIGLLLFGFIDYYLDVYIVTNERIVDIEQNGFFRRKISELHLHQVQDVNAQVKGAFATMLHYGDIHIQTAGERENFIFKAVPNPYRISKIIVDLHEAILEAGLAEEGGQIAEKIEEKEGETPSKFIGSSERPPLNLDSSTAKLARSRTKKCLGRAELIETGLGAEIQDELDEQHYDNILKKVEEDKNKTVFDQTNISKTKINQKVVEIKTSNKNGQKNSKTGEMHENEEIDI